jgi:nucleoside 2-deoxyribosyltransferase
MFNLLMRSTDWNNNRESMPLDRMFEYTAAQIRDQYQQGNAPNLDALTRLPCLFMEEGDGDQIAYVGHVYRARIGGAEIAIEYAIDHEVPPLRNSFIYEHRTAFDMAQRFEFSRNHWAVKDVDLYQVLLRTLRMPVRQRPVVFQLPEHEAIDQQQASAMMPFAGAFNAVYASIEQAAHSAGLRCNRADNIWENHAIMQDIVSLIDRSRIVVVDCTDRNPNVFYEAGIAHALGREVILITQNPEDVPFDLRHLRYIRYLNNGEGCARLQAELSARMRALTGR